MDALTRLAHDARGGNQRALEQFVEVSYHEVWRFCASLVGDYSAEDLVQETFIRVIRALPQFHGQSSARTWLLAIARHCCLDELRSQNRRHRRDANLGADTRCEMTAGDASHQALVADLLSCLATDRRIAFVLTQLLGLSYDEAAEVCGCPIGTIRSRVARARSELLDLLNSAEAERDRSTTPRPRAGGQSSPD